ncbi:SpoVT / AbrB like domain protein [archaeon]|nr:SpoVT / AbrB like domain protein [archaeon]
MYVKSKVSSKSQITLPKKLREALGIIPGDEIVFEKMDDKIILKVEKQADPVDALVGLVEEVITEKELRAEAADRMLKKKLGLE